jgi:copper(I)-binding protein
MHARDGRSHVEKPMTKKAVALAALALTVLAACGDEPVAQVDDPWVRTTVAEQKTTGAYMSITAAHGGTLVGVTSPIASSVEVHEMKMEGDVMHMRALDTLALPPGKKVEFKPNAYHLMLLGLKHPVKAGDVIPLALTIKDSAGKEQVVQVSAPAK